MDWYITDNTANHQIKKKKKSELVKEKFLEHSRKRGDREESLYLINYVRRRQKIQKKSKKKSDDLSSNVKST